jgi:hypothetical protein
MGNPSVRRNVRLNTETRVCSGLFLLDALLLCLATLKHTFWRDESQAWLIARDSPTLVSLMQNLRYEPHPPLWHLLLYAITRLSWNPEWMKLPNILCAIIAAGLVLFCQRLNLMTRIGIAFSYFFLFEYGVLARNYMLGVVLLVASTLLATGSSRSKSWTVPILLSLAALSSLPALVLASGVLLVYLYCELTLLRRQGQPASRLLHRVDLLLGTLLVAVSSLLSALMIRPPTDTGLFLSITRHATGPKAIFLRSGKFLTSAYIPVPVLAHQFWDSNIFFPPSHRLETVFDLVGWVLLAGFALCLRRPMAQCFYLVGSGILLLQLNISGSVGIRHLGWLFICLVLALLMQCADQTMRETKRPRWQRWMLSAVLLCQVYAGLFAIAVSLRYPFSSSLEVVEYLRSHSLGSAPLVIEPDYVGSSVLAYLQRPVAYDLERHRMASFILYNRDEFLNQHIPSRSELDEVSAGREAPVLIMGTPLTPAQKDVLKIHLLAAYNNAINPYDLYYIYR